MKSATPVGLKDVQAVYSGPEGQLWELVMGQQIHIGGFALVDGSGREGRHRAGHGGRRSLLLHRRRDAVPRRGSATWRGCTAWTPPKPSSSLAAAAAKPRGSPTASRSRWPTPANEAPRGERRFRLGRRRLVLRGRQAAADRRGRRLVKPGGVIAFTDWVDGRTPWADGEAERYRTFMKFPNTLALDGYASLLAAEGCEVLIGGRHRPIRPSRRLVPQHAEHAVDVRRPADHRLRHAR